MMQQQPPYLWLVTTCFLLVLGFNHLPAHGAKLSEQATPEPRPTITSIPRPMVTPGATQAYKQNHHEDAQIGAHIVLEVLTHSPQLGERWTVVQWQGLSGQWHDVDGWKGYTRQGRVRWFVAPAQFSRGAFRWQVFDQKDGELLGVSDNFYLPTSSYEGDHPKTGAT